MTMSIQSRWRPYHVECTGSLPNSEVKRHRARLVLGWGTAREDLRVLPAFSANANLSCWHWQAAAFLTGTGKCQSFLLVLLALVRAGQQHTAQAPNGIRNASTQREYQNTRTAQASARSACTSTQSRNRRTVQASIGTQKKHQQAARSKSSSQHTA